MDLKKPLEIECFILSEEYSKLQELGIDSKWDGGTNPITFYSIDNISTGYILDGRETGFICSGGDEYATIISYNELKRFISEHK